ncbi:Dyp-type peroxidase [Nocardioides sp.]|uniref:Dyp-type peroxidase n=1 Tax=Nocardioides sp. TaxID=35761 RepID=UPI0035287412
MAVPQTGIFALGTAAHAYLELDLTRTDDAGELVSALAGLAAGRPTTGAANLVVGVRPELWAQVAPDAAIVGLGGFTDPVVGQDGFTMPATQRDAVVWVAGPAQDVVFDRAVEVTTAVAGVAELVAETFGWTYHRDLDLTGFVDGTENPPLSEAMGEVVAPEGAPGAGGSVLLLQKWRHHWADWTSLSDAQQEQVMGRTKVDDEELDDPPETSHVARTDQADYGHILRRNTAYGTVLDHGTTFVGFASSRAPLEAMLASMAGVAGPRDALTRYSTPLTGGYYAVPALSDLERFVEPAADD